MYVELKAKIIGVESGFEGIILVIQQEKMKIPVAEDYDSNSDEAIIAKKLARSMKMVGINLNMGCQERGGFRTGFWMSTEDYEQMGKPTVGDMIRLNVEKLDEEQKISKPRTPFPNDKMVLANLKRLAKHFDNDSVPKEQLIREIKARGRLSQEDIDKAIVKLLREGTIYEPNPTDLKVVQ